MENFNEGDLVVCVDDTKTHPDSPPLIKDRKYVVYGILNHACGCVSLDVGLTAPNVLRRYYSVCRKHFVRKELNDNTHWCNSDRFRKIELQYRVVEVCSDLREEVKELIGQKENIDV